jgi:integrase/recombinase XerD
MLIEAAESYVLLRRGMGFALRYIGPLVLDFARFATKRGDRRVRTRTAIDWARRARSPARREFRLRVVIGFARHMHAEDAGHQVPPYGLLGPTRHPRPTPFIFTPTQIQSLVHEAHRLGPIPSLRRDTYATLIALLAATGLRVSEALALRVDDLTPDGLFVRNTKFRKSRLVPLHPTADVGLRRYLAFTTHPGGDRIFVHPNGRALPYAIVHWTFAQLARRVGIVAAARQPRPRLHCLRHTFAVRALEACTGDRLRIARHQLALATYLGHTHIESTYWYLQSTPHLLRGIARRSERLAFGDGP